MDGPVSSLRTSYCIYACMPGKHAKRDAERAYDRGERKLSKRHLRRLAKDAREATEAANAADAEAGDTGNAHITGGGIGEGGIEDGGIGFGLDCDTSGTHHRPGTLPNDNPRAVPRPPYGPHSACCEQLRKNRF